MFEVKPGVVNGDVIKDLIGLCNAEFTSPFIQEYAGARFECAFCGAMRNDKGGADHSAADCPVIKYQDIAEKHELLIDEI